MIKWILKIFLWLKIKKFVIQYQTILAIFGIKYIKSKSFGLWPPNDLWEVKTIKYQYLLKGAELRFRVNICWKVSGYIYLWKGTQSLETRVHMTNLTRSKFWGSFNDFPDLVKFVMCTLVSRVHIALYSLFGSPKGEWVLIIPNNH